MAKKKSIEIEIEASIKKAKMAVGELKTLIKQLKLEAKVTADTKKASITIKELETLMKQLKLEAKVTADTKEARATINELKKPTSSTHTVYVKEVFAKALGGLIAPIHRRLGGMIPGYDKAIGSFNGRMERAYPGYANMINPIKARTGRYFPSYGGGDRIPVMAEAGEFMLRKEAVRDLGLSAARAFNNRDIAGLFASLTAPVQRMQEGGPVQQAPSETVNLNLMAGGKTLKTTAPKDSAKKFIKDIKRMNIINGRAKRVY